MPRLFTYLLAGAAMVFCAGIASACENGVYRGPDGTAVIVTNRAPKTATPDWRWVFLDGRRGSAAAQDSPVHCTAYGLTVTGVGGATVSWSRVPVVETPAHFDSLGTSFNGMLIEPKDAPAGRPLVVVLHGSENTGALQFGMAYSYIFVAQGISVFTYDKRGTGTSGGFYSQNFPLLAADAAAASVEARRLAAGRYGRWGFFGGSQGGWIAPRAATETRPDFVEVGFGLVMTPLEEDQEQVLFELRRKGFSGKALSDARAVTDATGKVVSSHFLGGYEGLAAAKRRYSAEPWFGQIEGEFTGKVLHADVAELKLTGAARLDGLGIDWQYDAMKILRDLRMPQLWVLAGSDREAPGDLTRKRLIQLKQEGAPIDLWVYANTDHGITEYVEAPDGSRTLTRVSEGYYRLLGDWAKGRRDGSYGRGEEIGARPPTPPATH